MARSNLTVPGLPQFESTGNRARQGIPLYAAGEATRGDTALVGGISDAINTLGEGVLKLNAQRDAVTAVDAESKALVDAQKQIDDLNPLAADYNDRVKAIAQEARRRAVEGSGISTSVIQDDLSKRMERHGMALELSAQGMKKVAVSNEAARVYQNEANATFQKIRSDPANADTYLAAFQADAARLKTGIDPTKIGILADKFADDAVTAKVLGYAEKGNIGGARKTLNDEKAALSNGQYSALSNAIDAKESKFRADHDRFLASSASAVSAQMYDWAHGLGPPVPRTEIDKFKNTPQYASLVSTFGAATEKLTHKSEVEQEKAARKTAVDISGRISDAEAGKGPMPSREEIDALKAYNVWDNLVKEHNRVEVQVKKTQAELQGAIDAAANGFNNFKDQKQADLYFSAVIGNGRPFSELAAKGDAAQWQAASSAAVDMMSKGKFLPTDLKAFIENVDSTTNPNAAQSAGRAAQLLDDAEAVAPRAHSGISLQNSGTLAMIRAEAKRLMMEQGVSKEQAYLQAAQTSMTKGPATIQAENDRVTVAKEEIKRLDLPTEVKKAFRGETDFFQNNAPFAAFPEVDSAAQEAYKRAYEDAARKTENPDLRKRLATEAVGREFGVSKVSGGVGVAMRYPPERYLVGSEFLTADQKAAVIQQDILSIVKAKGLSIAGNKDFPSMPGFRLQAVGETEADIRAGRPPRYQLQFLRNLQYEPVPGLPLYRVPTADELKQSEAYKKFDAERIARDQKARQDYLDTERRNTEATDKLQRTMKPMPGAR